MDTRRVEQATEQERELAKRVVLAEYHWVLLGCTVPGSRQHWEMAWAVVHQVILVAQFADAADAADAPDSGQTDFDESVHVRPEMVTRCMEELQGLF